MMKEQRNANKTKTSARECGVRPRTGNNGNIAGTERGELNNSGERWRTYVEQHMYPSMTQIPKT